ncbi:MAG TPA: zf-HC2 domain-containing protein [Candidatus Saccharimonadales bacterium]|nr:zf-HC2 domain-containing protein [Candidatus Saccharimonadales bacterium]
MKENKDAAECREMRGLLPAFLADEIGAAESLRLQEHLNACPSCERYSRLEGAFDGALKRGIRREAAPATLVLRVNRALDAEAPQPGSASRPWGGRSLWLQWAFAASVLVALVGGGFAGVRMGYFTMPVSMAGVSHSAEGTLVCAECMRLNRPIAQQRGCRAHGHHTALRTDNGEIWEFVDNPATHPLLMDADHVGDRVEVTGLFIQGLRYVKVDAYHFKGAAAASQQGL